MFSVWCFQCVSLCLVLSYSSITRRHQNFHNDMWQSVVSQNVIHSPAQRSWDMCNEHCGCSMDSLPDDFGVLPPVVRWRPPSSIFRLFAQWTLAYIGAYSVAHHTLREQQWGGHGKAMWRTFELQRLQEMHTAPLPPSHQNAAQLPYALHISYSTHNVSRQKYLTPPNTKHWIHPDTRAVSMVLSTGHVFRMLDDRIPKCLLYGQL